VIDYRIQYSIDGSAFSVLVDGVTQTSYTATDLTTGSTYVFKV